MPKDGAAMGGPGLGSGFRVSCNIRQAFSSIYSMMEMTRETIYSILGYMHGLQKHERSYTDSSQVLLSKGYPDTPKLYAWSSLIAEPKNLSCIIIHPKTGQRIHPAKHDRVPGKRTLSSSL